MLNPVTLVWGSPQLIVGCCLVQDICCTDVINKPVYMPMPWIMKSIESSLPNTSPLYLCNLNMYLWAAKHVIVYLDSHVIMDKAFSLHLCIYKWSKTGWREDLGTRLMTPYLLQHVRICLVHQYPICKLELLQMYVLTCMYIVLLSCQHMPCRPTTVDQGRLNVY